MKNIFTIRCLVTWVVACILPVVPALCRSNSHASADSPYASLQRYRHTPGPFWTDNGRLTFGLQLAYGLENSIPNDISHINMVIAEPGIGVIAWDSPHSRLPIERFEVLGQGILGGSFHPGGEIVGASLLFRLGFKPRGRVIPYIDAGSGPVHTTIGATAPELTGSTQFLSQGGVGFQYFYKPHHALALEYHYFHMSNAGLQQPNPGFNGGMLTIGFFWLSGPRPIRISGLDGRWLHTLHFWRNF